MCRYSLEGFNTHCSNHGLIQPNPHHAMPCHGRGIKMGLASWTPMGLFGLMLILLVVYGQGDNHGGSDIGRGLTWIGS